MTVQELIALSSGDINSMTEKQLRAAVQTLASAANKRLKRLGESDIGRMSPAYEARVKSTGGADIRFSTKGKTLNQLRNEFVRARGFLGLKTSSISDWKKYRRKIEKKVGVQITDDKTFWRLYRKISELYGGNAGFESTQVIRDLHSILRQTTDEEEIIERMRRKIDAVYEEQQKTAAQTIPDIEIG